MAVTVCDALHVYTAFPVALLTSADRAPLRVPNRIRLGTTQTLLTCPFYPFSQPWPEEVSWAFVKGSMERSKFPSIVVSDQLPLSPQGHSMSRRVPATFHLRHQPGAKQQRDGIAIGEARSKDAPNGRTFKLPRFGRPPSGEPLHSRFFALSFRFRVAFLSSSFFSNLREVYTALGTDEFVECVDYPRSSTEPIPAESANVIVTLLRFELFGQARFCVFGMNRPLIGIVRFLFTDKARPEILAFNVVLPSWYRDGIVFQNRSITDTLFDAQLHLASYFDGGRAGEIGSAPQPANYAGSDPARNDSNREVRQMRTHSVVYCTCPGGTL